MLKCSIAKKKKSKEHIKLVYKLPYSMFVIKSYENRFWSSELFTGEKYSCGTADN